MQVVVGTGRRILNPMGLNKQVRLSRLTFQWPSITSVPNEKMLSFLFCYFRMYIN